VDDPRRAGADQMVLRFTADDIVMELHQWPEDWRSASMEEFAIMLLDAAPPRRPKKSEGPQRCHEDHVHLPNGGRADSVAPAP